MVKKYCVAEKQDRYKRRNQAGEAGFGGVGNLIKS
jgi:hypothetical protein